MTGVKEPLIDAQLAALVEISTDAIVSLTLDGMITSWNRAAERLYQYRAVLDLQAGQLGKVDRESPEPRRGSSFGHDGRASECRSPTGVQVTGSRCLDGGPARVLVMLDRPELVELVTMALNRGTCLVRTVRTVEQLATLVAEWQPHLLILDMALNGLHIMQQVRTRAISGLAMSVMGLVCRGDLRSKLAAFDAGADDILTIPFATEELLARVIALTRRPRTAPIASTPVITVGELEIDIVNRVGRARGSDMRLTPLEVGLLYLLAANPGRVLTREEILDTLWGTDNRPERNLVDQYVRKLRARLQTDGRLPRFIATVAGRGYRFLPSGQTG